MSHSDNPYDKYSRELRRIQDADLTPDDKAAIRELGDALDPNQTQYVLLTDDGKQKTLAYNTLATYMNGLRRFAQYMDYPLLEAPVEHINRVSNDLLHGIPDAAPDGGYSRGTLSIWQSALRWFYRYHDECGVDPETIHRFNSEETKVDERDMYDRDEVQAMRRAATHPRDRALLELFLNTGQRIRAIQTLRIKDVDLEESRYYLNDTVDGLKGADKRGLKRPLLGAKPAVARWLEHHPDRDNREAALITAKRDIPGRAPGDRLTKKTIRGILNDLGEAAGVKKPLNPQNFRHYFVTIAKRNYGMDEATIKYLIGHAKDSRVMETTYSHLTGDDFIRDAEIATGHADPDAESPLTPEVCTTCNAILEEDAKACAACGAIYAPDAVAAQEQTEELSFAAMREAEDEQEKDDVEDFRQLLKDNPEEAVAILNKELQET